MGLLDTLGDSSAFVKYSGGSVQIGAGGATQVSVSAGSTTLSNLLNCQAGLTLTGSVFNPALYTSANLPAGSTGLSGAVVFVSDTKRLAVYGPGGWTFIATGSAP